MLLQAPCSLSPKGIRHSFANIGDQPTKMLFLYAPAGMEAMFAENRDARGPRAPRTAE